MTDRAPASATTLASTNDWDAFVAGHPLATYLQVSAWAAVKATNGWSSRVVEARDSTGGRVGGQVLVRRPSASPWAFAYAPRGPLAELWGEDALAAWTDELRSALRRARSADAIAHVRVDPEIATDGSLDPGGATSDAFGRLGWRPAPDVQPSVTRIVDLDADEAALWSDLRKKWRQYVNRARTLGVTVRDVDADADPTSFRTFHRVMVETSRRTGLAIRTEAAYRDIWNAFRPMGGVRLLVALGPEGDAQAVLLLVRCGLRVVEPYGGMTAAGAESRANYLLKWEAIRTSRGQGASSYDMWGLVHPGIRQFKEGFGGREVRLIGAWDLPLSGIGSRLFRLAEGGRRRGRTASVAIGSGQLAAMDD